MNFFKNLTKLFAPTRKGAPSCEQVLGNRIAVNHIAEFHRRAEDTFTLAQAHVIHRFVLENSMSAREIDIYKQSQRDLGAFFLECYMEMENEKEKEKI